jgi:diacylglycerol kinase family enzyme
MRVTLLHKPSSGDGAHARDDLEALFETHGHSVLYRSTDDDDDWPAVLDESADCVVAAGGDGTVESVALRLAGRSVPLAVLPLGTANNIAWRLGSPPSPDQFIAGLAEATPQPFDVGVARGPWGVRRFVDGVGLGAFTRAMSFVKAEQGDLVTDPSEREASLHRDLRLLRTFLRETSARPCTLDLDGDTDDVSYLLLEATNTGLIGPNVELAPEADCCDGLLDIVVISEVERKRLDGYLEARLAGDAVVAPQLPVRRARQVRLTIDAMRVHIDGDVWPESDASPPAAGAPFEVHLRVEPGALNVLVPSG